VASSYDSCLLLFQQRPRHAGMTLQHQRACWFKQQQWLAKNDLTSLGDNLDKQSIFVNLTHFGESLCARITYFCWWWWCFQGNNDAQRSLS